ncbi:MAG: right-handed parallel beta-helix repeat-containing protein [Gemmataceae bacterium]|nr:right-handed parallel beta-helix repeat-containing protein [Gemmataceae bacterium]
MSKLKTVRNKPATTTRVFIVDDHPIVREGLAAQIGLQPGLEICGEADDLAGALARIESARPDVALIDISLKSGSGIDLIKRLRARDQKVRILVWSMYPESLYAERALRAGAQGYVHKGQSTQEILDALRAVSAGKVYVSGVMAERFMKRLVGGQARALRHRKLVGSGTGNLRPARPRPDHRADRRQDARQPQDGGDLSRAHQEEAERGHGRRAGATRGAMGAGEGLGSAVFCSAVVGNRTGANSDVGECTMSGPRCIAAVILFGTCAVPIRAATWHVPRDFKTIQAAVDAAKPGDTVLVEAGTYREQVRLKERVTVRSAGDEAKGQRGLQRAEAAIIDGGGAAAPGPPGVVLAEASILDGFTITRFGLFDQKEYDKHYASQGENLPDDRGAVGAGKDFPAVSVSGVTAVVRHCIVHDNGRAGIGCMGDGNRSWVFQNIVYRNMGGGIGIADGAAPTVESNICFNNLRGGIGSRRSAGLILKNQSYDNVRAGIGIREGAKPIVQGNKCYKNRRAGIGVRMENTAPVIDDNDCYQNAMAGIGAGDGASPLILRNRCYENTLAGIGSRDDAKPQIVGNQCYRNKKAGIGFDACQSGKALVIHNKVIDNDAVAIGIHGGWKVRIVDNVLSRDGGMPPIVMVFKDAEADFAENTITGSGVAGIRTEGVVRIVKNKFECPSLRKGGGPPQFAVWGLPGSKIVYMNNTVKGWRHALHADKATVVASYNQVSGYWQAGIQVTRPVAPVVAIGNVFRSKEGHPGVVAPTGQGIVEHNRVEKGPAPK